MSERPWIQGYANQKALLDSFFGALEPKKSLVFVYAKRTPLTDDDQWIIVGVGRVTSIGELKEWDYDPPKHDLIRSYLWERSVCHSIRADGGDGVLLPYHDLLARCEKDADIDPHNWYRFRAARVPRRVFRHHRERHVASGAARLLLALLSVKEALAS